MLKPEILKLVKKKKKKENTVRNVIGLWWDRPLPNSLTGSLIRCCYNSHFLIASLCSNFSSFFILRAYSNCSGPGFSVHSGIVMSYITNYGSEEQIKHFIPQMTAGKCIGAIAMTELGAGR